MSDARIITAGDAAFVVEYGDRIDPAVNARATGLAGRIVRAHIPGVRDVVPTFRSVAVYYDPLIVDADLLRRTLGQAAAEPGLEAAENVRRTVVVPVCYGEEYGPDLAEVARFAGVSEDKAVALHSAAEYRVFMLGFMPGFAYLGTVEARIAMPRKAMPRTWVAAGSVGIAGPQTGIYPRESPGGWQIVGRTPLVTFDPQREQPCLLRTGDAVRFQPISFTEFAGLSQRPGTGA